MRADAGIVISASHNPYDDNGIKIFGADGFKLARRGRSARSSSSCARAKRSAARQPARGIGRAEKLEDARGRYVVFAKRTFPHDLSLDGLRVVVDAAHGAAYRVAPLVLAELGANVTAIGVKPNGTNINKDCGALHPDHVRAEVVKRGAHIGIALDGDADRVIVVDEKGQIVDGDAVMAMCATRMLEEGTLKKKHRRRHGDVNLGLERALEAAGAKLVRTQVGDRYVVEAMREGGYNLGGEQSGHLVFLDHASTGDGTVAALQVLALMLRTGKPLSELAARAIERVPQVLENVTLPLAQTARGHAEARRARDEGRARARRRRAACSSAGAAPSPSSASCSKARTRRSFATGHPTSKRPPAAICDRLVRDRRDGSRVLRRFVERDRLGGHHERRAIARAVTLRVFADLRDSSSHEHELVRSDPLDARVRHAARREPALAKVRVERRVRRVRKRVDFVGAIELPLRGVELHRELRVGPILENELVGGARFEEREAVVGHGHAKKNARRARERSTQRRRGDPDEPRRVHEARRDLRERNRPVRERALPREVHAAQTFTREHRSGRHADHDDRGLHDLMTVCADPRDRDERKKDHREASLTPAPVAPVERHLAECLRDHFVARSRHASSLRQSVRATLELAVWYAAGVSAQMKLVVPRLAGETGRVAWSKHDGEVVTRGETVCEVHLDFMTVPVSAPSAGKLVEVLVQDGSVVGGGVALGIVESSGEDTPRAIGWVTMECTFRCRACGFDVPLLALDLDGSVVCLRCGLDQAFDKRAWHEAFDLAHAVADGTTTVVKKQTIQGDNQMRVTAMPHAPRCAACEGPLDVELDAASALAHCAACKTDVTYVVPDAATRMTKGALRAVLADEHRADALVKVQDTAGAIAIQCPSCSAALDADAKTKFVSCKFCNTKSRIPERVWMRLRGGDPKPAAMWLAFAGESRTHREAQKQKEKSDEDALLERLRACKSARDAAKRDDEKRNKAEARRREEADAKRDEARDAERQREQDAKLAIEVKRTQTRNTFIAIAIAIAVIVVLALTIPVRW